MNDTVKILILNSVWVCEDIANKDEVIEVSKSIAKILKNNGLAIDFIEEEESKEEKPKKAKK